MRLITRKSEIKTLLKKCLDSYEEDGLKACVDQVHQHILLNKVKFPLLEYCATVFHTEITVNEHIQFCDAIEALKTEGGNVILGIMLQKRLSTHFEQTIDKTTQYIANADVWYVCDIIGERVYGFSLLNNPAKSFSEIKKLASHSSPWVIRSLGAGAHYAIKKGLEAKHVSTLFSLLLTLANTQNKEIRQGIGWAAKTTAKFHPKIIVHFQKEINNQEIVANWFRKKIEIGSSRHTHAQRN